MGVDVHERRRRNGETDSNPACRTPQAYPRQGEIGSWKGGKSRGQVIGDFYRAKYAQRLSQRRASLDGKSKA